MRQLCHFAVVTLLSVAALATPAGAAQGGLVTATANDGWTILIATRNALAQAPQELLFEQSFVPAGFSSGDLETGVVSFDLPDCLRWDYHLPDPRSYLLCDHTAMLWNEGEDSGRRLQLDDGRSGAFDLWLAPMDDLRRRYQAVRVDINAEYSAVRITPSDRFLAEDVGFAVAEITIDQRTGLPSRFEYRDQEGSQTAFEFAASKLLSADDPRFTPPSIEWVEDD